MRHCMLYDWIGWPLSCICHFFYNLYTDTLCILSQWQIWAVVHSSSFTSGPLWPHSARWIDRGLFTRQPRGVEQSGAVRDGVVTWGYAGYVWPHTPPYIPPTNPPYIPTPPLLHSHLFDHLLCVCDIKLRVSKIRFMLVILDHIHPHNMPISHRQTHFFSCSKLSTPTPIVWIKYCQLSLCWLCLKSDVMLFIWSKNCSRE